MKKDRLINLHYGDMTYSSSLIRIIQMVQPDEIYNLAAQSHVKVSFDVPEYTASRSVLVKVLVEVDAKYFRPLKWSSCWATRQKPRHCLVGIPRKQVSGSW